jgi:hypothetical protein
MPLYTWDTQADWDAMYRKGGEPDGGYEGRSELKLGYQWAVQESKAIRKAGFLAAYLGTPLPANTRMCFVGGAWGWVAEKFLTYGLVTLCVTDTSSYIQNSATENDDAELSARITGVGLDSGTGRGLELFNRYRKGSARADVSIQLLNEDVLLNAGRNAVRQAIGNPDYVVTEDMLTSLSDAECEALNEACHAWGGAQTVVHMVSLLQPDTNHDSRLNWKTGAEWRALADTWGDPCVFMDVRTGATY